MINAEILREYDIRGIYQKSLKLEDVENIAKKISNIISNINTPKIEITKYIMDDFIKIFTIEAIIIPINPIIKNDPILVKSLLVVYP